MKKIMNDPQKFVDDVISGVLTYDTNLVAVGGDRRLLVHRQAIKQGRVSIITGGGSGHLPLFLGYVAPGLCSGVAIGNVFSSPSASQIHELTKAVDGGEGVLYLFGNYGGDVLNFGMATNMSESDSIRVETVVCADDVMSAPAERSDDRRGIAGMALVYKCTGAAASNGASLQEVAAVARRANAAVRTAGVGLSPAVLPTTGNASFALDEGEMEIGIGIHGEPGVERSELKTAAEIAVRLLMPILEELHFQPGDEVAMLINGLGATPQEELHILSSEAQRVLEPLGVSVTHLYVGEYVTSLEMAGASISVMKLTYELGELLSAPSDSRFVSFGGDR